MMFAPFKFAELHSHFACCLSQLFVAYQGHITYKYQLLYFFHIKSDSPSDKINDLFRLKLSQRWVLNTVVRSVIGQILREIIMKIRKRKTFDDLFQC